MASQTSFLTAQFLTWVENRPRTRAELRDAWQSTCPLNSAWEDALAEDLVTFADDGRLILTAKGRAALPSARARP